jgi:predicted ATP-grasp superfamily ATP-dependent carboligase
LPKSSRAEAGSILIAAVSGRALAAAARRAGYIPLVADFFADADTERLAPVCVQLDDLRAGFRWETLSPALDELVRRAPSPPLGLVCGAGFEDRTELLSRLASRYTLIGNDAVTVARTKDPEAFFGTLAKLGIPHPRTLMSPPASPAGWLSKRRGGAGGSHVAKATEAGLEPGGDGGQYFQEFVGGRPVSALFVANGREASVLGYSEQWAAPHQGAEWRYGGAVQPAAISADLAASLASHVHRLVPELGLKGLGSADFLVDGPHARLLEVNPRPGATLDIFDSVAQPILHLHIQAVLQGILPMAPLPPKEATAAAIVYASAPVLVEPGMVWPDWTSDQPKRGERISKGRPICTVLARADTAPAARRLSEERRKMILSACAGQKGDML